MKLLEMPKWKPSDLIATDIAAMADMVEAIQRTFAVGRFWISTDDTNPAEILGGTWKSIGSGRVLMTPGFTYEENQPYDKPGQTGGSATHRHLTSMGADGLKVFALFGSGFVPIYGSEVIGDAQGIIANKDEQVTHTQLRVSYTKEEGNLPPFYTCHIWERVS